MRAVELGLGAPTGCLTELSVPNSSELRLNHYPQIDIQEMTTGNAARAWPHTDSGVISLLLQDEVGGLEFEDRQNSSSFIRLSSNGSMEMIVNVADTLERWTNGVLRAGLHRVNNPEMQAVRGMVASRRDFLSFSFQRLMRMPRLGPYLIL